MRIWRSELSDEVMLQMPVTVYLSFLDFIKGYSKYMKDEYDMSELSDHDLDTFFRKTSAILSANTIWRKIWDLIYWRKGFPKSKMDEMYLQTAGEHHIKEYIIRNLEKKER